MIRTDEDALICDFAQTYGAFDYKALPLKQAAVLAVGLGDDSRIKRIFNGTDATKTELMLAGIADRLSVIMCALTGNKTMPEMITNVMLGIEKEEEQDDVLVFDSAEAFEKTRKRLLEERG